MYLTPHIVVTDAEAAAAWYARRSEPRSAVACRFPVAA